MRCMKLFYSWQSDEPTGRAFIADALRQVSDVIGIEIETATRDKVGSPDISATIIEKIDASDLFLADVSIINSMSEDARKMPNPNVMFELGYAMKSLGEDNIILVANTDITDIALLPFDIRNRRMALESFGDKGAKKALMHTVSAAITNYSPAVKENKVPAIVFQDENLRWANYGIPASGSFCGFSTILHVDNYKGESDYIVSILLTATSANNEKWIGNTFVIGNEAQNSQYEIPANKIFNLHVYISDKAYEPRMMPDIDTDSAVLKIELRSGKKFEFKIKPVNLRQD